MHDIQPGYPISDQITGLYETHLPVASLERARAFYQGALNLSLARAVPERRVEFYWVGSPQNAMLGLWETGSAPLGMKLHFAFHMPVDHLLNLCEQLRELDIEPLDFFGNPTHEPTVIGWMPALSVYCKDPDGHSVEFICKLSQTPDFEFGQGSYSSWRAKHG